MPLSQKGDERMLKPAMRANCRLATKEFAVFGEKKFNLRP